jgi:type VI secretion system protein ImpA
MSVGGLMHLDIETLLQPGSERGHEGEALPLALREELDRARRRASATQDGDKGPRRVLESPWEEIVAKAAGRMAQGVRDLGLAARLTEAMTRLSGFTGLRDGLHLMRRLVEECWDELTPRPKAGGDLGPLLAPLRWIDDPDRGALFPHTVRAVPLVHQGDRTYSWIDWKRLRDRGDKVSWGAFERALYATPRAELEEALDGLEQSQDELARLTAGLAARSSEPFEMPGLWRAIEDCRTLIEHILQQVPAPERDGGNEVELADPDYPATWMGDGDEVGFTQTQLRARIYAQIEQLASTLQQIEPHSPVPHLLMRAVQLGAMPFPQLMSELLRDQNVLGRMNQELGIRPNP